MQNENREHPSLEILAALAEGRLGHEEKTRVTAHLAHCEDCYTLFASASRFVEATREESGERELPAGVRRRRMWTTIAVAAGIILVSLVTIIAVRTTTRGPLGRVVETANALPYRLTEGRLSGDFAYRPAQPLTRGPDDDRDPRWLKLQGAAGEVLESNPGPHQAANAYFATGEAARAEAMLVKLTSTDRENAKAWNDLAVARLQIALKSADPSLLPGALAAADRALRISPELAAAQFNRALVTERLGLLSEARAAWEHYLSLDSESEWAVEARERLAALRTATDSWKTISSDIDAFLHGV